MLLEKALDAVTVRTLLTKIQQRLFQHSSYFGVPTWQMPMDLWVYRELIFKAKPDVILEIGTYCGGGALAYAHICDNMNHGRVIAVDLTLAPVQKICKDHPRITFIEGDGSLISDRIKAMIKPGETVLVIEDSSHFDFNTLACLRAYSPLIKVGGYYIVEDTICWHGLNEGPNPGPWEGVAQFLAENRDFVSDRSMESFVLTWNPTGFLKRVK